MAILTQLKDARNAGLNLAKATQDFAQVDILSANTEAPEVVAALKVVADAAIAASVGIGGEAVAPPLPATDAIVSSGSTVPVQSSAGNSVGTGTVTVVDNAVTAVKLPENIGSVADGSSRTLAGTVYTFTVTLGVITAITSVPA